MGKLLAIFLTTAIILGSSVYLLNSEVTAQTEEIDTTSGEVKKASSVKLNHFKVDSTLECFPDNSGDGFIHYYISTSLQANGEINSKLTASFNPHLQDGTKIGTHKVILEEFNPGPKSFDEHIKLNGRIPFPIHASSAGIDIITFAVEGKHVSSGEEFYYEYRHYNQSC